MSEKQIAVFKYSTPECKSGRFSRASSHELGEALADAFLQPDVDSRARIKAGFAKLRPAHGAEEPVYVHRWPDDAQGRLVITLNATDLVRRGAN